MDEAPGRPVASIAARDAALARLWRLRRWLILGSFAAAGVVTGVAAQAKPGKSSASSSSAAPGASSQRSGDSAARLPIPGTSNSGSAPLSPPSAAPAPAPAAPAPTTSGGS